MKSMLSLSRASFDAVIFDLDGVVTQTAKVHASAWKELFDAYRDERLKRNLPAYEPFDPERDYRLYVDGKPRHAGLQSFFEARGIDIPYGHPDDPPEQETVCGLAHRKNQLFQQLLRRSGVQVYDSTVQLIHQLRAQGFKVAIISASANCSQVLQAARVQHLFQAQVDGVVAAELHLKGKPAPDVFLEAARRLGAETARTVVVEDALAGVEAGRQGNFGLVIGVDRTGYADSLRKSGAHAVVTDLSEITISDAATRPPTPTANLPSALARIEEIIGVQNRRLVLLLDYDGTLTPIVAHPEEAVLSVPMREVLQRLARIYPVAVISGRDLADVRQRVDLEEIIYAGSHGFDIAGPNGMRWEHPEAQSCRPALDQAAAEMRAKIEDLPGAQIERKKYSLAIHFRNVDPSRVREVESAVKAVAAAHPNLRQGHGKKVFELQPKLDWHKGQAVWWLLRTLALDQPEALPIYLGDDLTDEDAFAALRERGVGIVVRDENRLTAARYALENPSEVGSFLVRLAQLE